MKLCPSCGQEKHEFHKTQAKCKDCRSKERAERYRLNKEAENLAKQKWREANPAKTRAIDALRRTRKRVEYEEIHPEAIFIRDGWICGICNEPVHREISYPDPHCASLDHIIPLSLGGGHVWDNLQCAHLVCNLRKGNKVD